MVFFHMFSASLKKWQHHRNHWMQRGHLKFLVQDKGPAASCPSGRTLTGCWCKSTTGRGDNCVKVWGDLDWLVFFWGLFFFSRKLASASWSPSCFSKELGGWNLQSHETSCLTTPLPPRLPGSQAVWPCLNPPRGHRRHVATGSKFSSIRIDSTDPCFGGWPNDKGPKLAWQGAWHENTMMPSGWFFV